MFSNHSSRCKKTLRNAALLLGAIQCWYPVNGVADTWRAPTPEHRSANRRFILKVDYGLLSKNRIRLMRVDDEKQVELWQRGYVDKIWPPHKAYVSNDGQRVILRDVYHNLGRGMVLVFLNEKGEVIKSYELEDLLTEHERFNAEKRVSSTWWSEPGWFAFRDDDRQFAFVTNEGGIACFETRKGQRVDVTEELRRQIAAKSTTDALAQLQSDDPNERASGTTMLGALRAIDQLSAIKVSLQDQSSMGTGCLGLKNCGPNLIVRLAAAKSLVRILGDEALPVIEKVLDEENLYMFYSLLSVMASVDRGILEPREPFDPEIVQYWERLTQSPSHRVRDYAILQRLVRDDGSYVRAYPKLLQSPKDGIRWNAFRAFIKKATCDDIDILKAATNDSFDMVRSTARYAISRLDPEFVLKLPDSRPDDFSLKISKIHALGEKARRGDRHAMNIFLDALKSMTSHTHGPKGECPSVKNADIACELAAECKWPSAREPLEQAIANPCNKIQRMAAKALSAYGDKSAILKLRGFAVNGKSIDRAQAIRALGKIKDVESKPLLEKSLHDSERWVSEAAREAIENFNTSEHKPKP